MAVLGSAFITIQPAINPAQFASQANAQLGAPMQRVGMAAGNQMGMAMGRALVLSTGNLLAMMSNALAPVAAAFAAIGVAAVKASVAMETSLAKSVTLASLTTDQLGAVKAQLLALGPAVGVGPGKLADAFYRASSAGFDAAASMAIVTSAAKGTAIGLGDTARLVDTTTSALKAYEGSGLTAAQVTDTLTAAAKAAKLEASELAPQLGRILPIASQLGVSFEEVNAAMSFLSQTSGSASLAATQLVNVLSKIAGPTVAGSAALREAGLSANELRAVVSEQGLLAGIQALAPAMLSNSEAAKAMFGNIRGLAGFYALARDNGAAFGAMLDQVSDSAGVTDEAMKVLEQTTGFRLKQAWAQAQAALVKFGDALAPLVQVFASFTQTLSAGFGSIPKPILLVVGVLGALVAVAVPLIGILGRLSAALTFLGFSAARTAAVVKGIGVAMGALGVALTAATVMLGVWANEQRRAKEIADQFANTIVNTADDIATAATNWEALAGAGETSGEALAALGITFEEFSASVLNGTPLYKEAQAELQRMALAASATGEAVDYTAFALDQLITNLKKAAPAVFEFATQTARMKAEQILALPALQGNTKAQELFAQRIKEGTTPSLKEMQQTGIDVVAFTLQLRDAAIAAMAATEDLTAGLTEEEIAARDLEAAIGDVDAVFQQFNKTFEAQAAFGDVFKDLQQAITALGESSGSLDMLSGAGLTAYQNIISAGQGLQDFIIASLEARVPVEELQRQIGLFAGAAYAIQAQYPQAGAILVQFGDRALTVLNDFYEAQREASGESAIVTNALKDQMPTLADLAAEFGGVEASTLAAAAALEALDAAFTQITSRFDAPVAIDEMRVALDELVKAAQATQGEFDGTGKKFVEVHTAAKEFAGGFGEALQALAKSDDPDKVPKMLALFDEVAATLDTAGLSATQVGEMVATMLADMERELGTAVPELKVAANDLAMKALILSPQGQAAAEAFGAALAAGTIVGIMSGSAGVGAAAASLVDTALKVGKGQAKIQSPSRLFAEELGRPIAEGIAEGINERAAAVHAALSALITAAAAASAKAAQENAAAVLARARGSAGTQVTMSSLLFERKSGGLDVRDYIDDASALTAELQALVVSYMREVAEQTAQVATDFELQAAGRVAATFQAMLDAAPAEEEKGRLADLMAQFVELADVIGWTTSEYLTNHGLHLDKVVELQGKVAEWKDAYVEALTEIGATVGPKTLAVVKDLQLPIESLQELGGQVTQFASGVRSAIEGEVDLLGEFSGEAHVTADSIVHYLQTQKDRLAQWAADLKYLAENGVPPELIEQLSLQGPTEDTRATIEGLKEAVRTGQVAVISQLVTDLSEMAGTTTDELSAWLAPSKAKGIEIGTSITDGIKAGLEDDAAVLGAMRALMDRLVEEARNQIGAHSPSEVFEDGVGVPISQGIAAGVEKAAPSVTGALAELLSGDLLDVGADAARRDMATLGQLTMLSLAAALGDADMKAQVADAVAETLGAAFEDAPNTKAGQDAFDAAAGLLADLLDAAGQAPQPAAARTEGTTLAGPQPPPFRGGGPANSAYGGSLSSDWLTNKGAGAQPWSTPGGLVVNVYAGRVDVDEAELRRQLEAVGLLQTLDAS